MIYLARVDVLFSLCDRVDIFYFFVCSQSHSTTACAILAWDAADVDALSGVTNDPIRCRIDDVHSNDYPTIK